eukprot:m51a1_g4866 hypothetical protein (527) ;mRNA; f:339151-340926
MAEVELKDHASPPSASPDLSTESQAQRQQQTTAAATETASAGELLHSRALSSSSAASSVSVLAVLGETLPAVVETSIAWLSRHDPDINVAEAAVDVVSVVPVYPAEQLEVDRCERRQRDSDARAASRRKLHAVSVAVPAGLAVVTLLFVAAVSCIYWVPLWSPFDHLHRMPVGVVDADVPYRSAASNRSVSLGAALVAALRGSGRVGVHALPAGTTYARARQLVRNDDYWSVLWIPSNCSSTYGKAYFEGSGAKGYRNAVYYIQDPAKQTTTSGAVEKLVRAVLGAVVSRVVRSAFDGSMPPHANATPAAALLEPLTVVSDSLFVVSKNGWSMAVYLTVTFLFSTAILSTLTLASAIHRQDSERLLGFWHVVLARYAGTAAILAAAAGAQVAVLAGLGMPASRGHAQVWGVLYLSALALSGMVNALFAWLGFLGLLLGLPLLYVGIVSSGGLYHIALLPASWHAAAYVLPLWHSVSAWRHSCFGTLPRQYAMHIGCLVAWAVVAHAVGVLGLRYGWGDKKMKRKTN